MVIGYKDGEFIECEADDFDTLLEIYNNASYALWGKSHRKLIVTTYGDAKMTLDETDEFMRGNRP